MWTQTPVLVTGAGGFIGRALCQALQIRDAQVHGTQRLRPVPPGVHAHPVPTDRWNSGPTLAELVHRLRPEVVFHLGAPVDPVRDPSRFEQMSQGILQSSAALAQACLDTETRLVHVSTCEVYGDAPAPFREDQALRPVSPYSAAKAAADLWLQTLIRTQDLRATIVRPFLTYGAHQGSGALIPSAIAAAIAHRPFPMTQGTQTRELNHVADVAQGLLLCAQPQALGQTLNLCCGEDHSVRSLVERVYRLAQADPELVQVGALPQRAGESTRFYGDPSRINALGYQPMIALDQGLSDCIAEARRVAAP